MLYEQLAVRCALESLKARLALDCLGGSVLLTPSVTLSVPLTRAKHVRSSAGSSPPWGRQRPCGRASAVLCVLMSDCSARLAYISYLAPLPMLASCCCQSLGYECMAFGLKFLDCEAWQTGGEIFYGRGVWPCRNPLIVSNARQRTVRHPRDDM